MHPFKKKKHMSLLLELQLAIECSIMGNPTAEQRKLYKYGPTHYSQIQILLVSFRRKHLPII
jgi:hypothetical protein